MYIARKDGIVYITEKYSIYELSIYENERLVASNYYESIDKLNWECYCQFRIKSDDWRFIDYLPEPYRNWSSIDEVKNSYGGESILLEETWDIFTGQRQYLAVNRNEDGTWNTPDKKLKDSDIEFIVISESS